MREKNPDKYAKTLSVKVSEEEHNKLKMLAVREKTTIKSILLGAVDTVFPDWRKEK